MPIQEKQTNDKMKLPQSPLPLIVLPLESIKKRIIKDFLKRYNGTVIPTQEKQTNNKIKLAPLPSLIQPGTIPPHMFKEYLKKYIAKKEKQTNDKIKCKFLSAISQLL
ncbi:unnamed protein product [Plutella xylostella]|uniref:(diamondback moth) hypothetical protein n=1 Tax=Plutella xylostella TaxID=51655 RepID=A0A8S4G0F3_PLUXY|nr:unnamed protein product [Plutella xylostella]